MHIALLEDDKDQADVLKAWLSAIDCTVTHFELGEPLLHAIRQTDFDLYLLDWQLPDLSGLEVVKWIRQHIDWEAPVIFLTVRDDESDIVSALEAGADDYITKPLSASITMARISAVLRRAHVGDDVDHIEAAPFGLDLSKRQITLNGELIVTTQREFDLTAYFFGKVGRVLSRATLMKDVWGISQQLNTRTVDTHVCRIRSKLHIQPENGWCLSSVYQYGYRLERVDKSH